MSDMEMACEVEAADRVVALMEADMPGPEPESRCPVCGNTISWCQGHGEIGDPDGAAILVMHDEDDHACCHPQADCQSENGAP